ncbi:unnamed protein product [Zymoseptoria tritici ST99CH_1A5]|uniref:MHD domain-containing protein n=3 Tax=Zymoseptoria tritici TaxID=1047171 RepID=A0A1X7RWN2_ZYMT9|nr:unnamed protein product [Zymoseptoria tritici ST99CH_3D7]SMR54116.1 unnamed protein product [Zymoseptoria tritici ST99CH_1E4]SMY25422.1 unnamed protein product [Zymoseptoria tritici ST99CH_1A5]
MANSMDRPDYPGLLQQLQPAQAADILNDRVRQVGRLNTTIADWLQERTRLEEQYAAGLRKLARQKVDDADLGIFTVPWNTMTSSLETLAESHTGLATRIQADIERPLREYATNNRDMQAMTTVQGNLNSLAKEVEKGQQKVEKLRVKGEKADANKVADAQSDVDNARVQWNSQAPYVFKDLQSLDETRCNHLRDLLTQLQTLEADQIQKSSTAPEQCLNVLLNVETQDEIQTFVLRAMSMAQNPSSANANPRNSFMPGSSSGPNRTSSSLAAPPSRDRPDDATSQVSEEPKKGGLKGLRRLGTVMSRRRESKLPAMPLPSTAESPERKQKSSPFGRLGRSKESYSLEPPQEENNSQRPRSPQRLGSEAFETPETRQGTARSSSGAPQLGPIPTLNGNSTATSSHSPIATNFPNGSHQGDLADLQPPQPSPRHAPQLFQQQQAQPYPPPSQPYPNQPLPQIPVAETQRDDEGFSVPPSNLDPISQAQAEAAAEAGSPQFNVNIRNAPIEEEGGDAALASVATKLQAPPAVSARRAGTVRGRRDARNSAAVTGFASPPSSTDLTTGTLSQAAERSATAERLDPSVSSPVSQPMPMVAESSTPSLVQSPSGGLSPTSPTASSFSPFSPASDAQIPFRPSSRALNSEQAGDSNSIRSGRSTASQGMRHPDLHEPGLTSSIIETVSARFDQGQIATSSLIGEIALAYTPTDATSPPASQTIRLDQFSRLEKVAPNPAFISQNLDKEGEYTVNLGNIAKTQIAFKYQLRHDDANTHAPLLLVPAYKIEPTQASVIVSYSLNPAFALQGRESLTLSNVLIALTLEGAKGSSCLSRPTGTFVRDKNVIYWQLGEVTLTAGAAPEKLLARFATDSEAKGGSIEARWEISGENARGLGSPLGVSQLAGAGDSSADPFADEDAVGGAATGWSGVPAVRKLINGNYVAKS